MFANSALYDTIGTWVLDFTYTLECLLKIFLNADPTTLFKLVWLTFLSEEFVRREGKAIQQEDMIF